MTTQKQQPQQEQPPTDGELDPALRRRLVELVNGPDANAATEAARVLRELDPANGQMITVGIDVGQLVDYSAIVICEAIRCVAYDEDVEVQTDATTGTDTVVRRWRTVRLHHVLPSASTVGYSVPEVETVYWVRAHRRLELRTGYGYVANRVVEALTHPELLDAKRAGRIQARMDVTGVGRGVYETVKSKLAAHPHAKEIRLTPVTFTHGEQWTRKGWEATLGKGGMASRLAALVQPPPRIRVPGTITKWPDLVSELRSYQMRVAAATGLDTYGAMSPGAHDDLITALGLATAVPEEPYRQMVRYADFTLW